MFEEQAGASHFPANTEERTAIFVIALRRCVPQKCTGVPLVYELDDDLKVIPHKDAIAPLQGRYLGDLEAVKARIAGVANQTK